MWKWSEEWPLKIGRKWEIPKWDHGGRETELLLWGFSNEYCLYTFNWGNYDWGEKEEFKESAIKICWATEMEAKPVIWGTCVCQWCRFRHRAWEGACDAKDHQWIGSVGKGCDVNELQAHPKWDLLQLKILYLVFSFILYISFNFFRLNKKVDLPEHLF